MHHPILSRESPCCSALIANCRAFLLRSDQRSVVVADLTFVAVREAMSAPSPARMSDGIGAQIKTNFVVNECGSVSSEVKNHAPKKKIAVAAAMHA